MEVLPSDLGLKTVVRGVRGLVSTDRKRLKDDKFDLDLTYITPRLISMGFPAGQLLQQAIRNNINEVRDYLQENHGNNYMVFNTSEKNYDASCFDNHVAFLPWRDHHAPPLKHLYLVVQKMHEWLTANEKNVAVVHCKAGKGRTGTAVSAYLLYSGECETAEKALHFFAFRRSHIGRGVTVPSQIRYVKYIDELFKKRISKKVMTEPETLIATKLIMKPIPDIAYMGGLQPSIEIIDLDTDQTIFEAHYETRVINKNSVYVGSVLDGYVAGMGEYVGAGGSSGAVKLERIVFDLEKTKLTGDMLVRVYHVRNLLLGAAPELLFRFAFHTSFVGKELGENNEKNNEDDQDGTSNSVNRRKEKLKATFYRQDLDSPSHGHLKDKRIPLDFCLEMEFERYFPQESGELRGSAEKKSTKISKLQPGQINGGGKEEEKEQENVHILSSGKMMPWICGKCIWTNEKSSSLCEKCEAPKGADKGCEDENEDVDEEELEKEIEQQEELDKQKSCTVESVCKPKCMTVGQVKEMLAFAGTLETLKPLVVPASIDADSPVFPTTLHSPLEPQKTDIFASLYETWNKVN